MPEKTLSDKEDIILGSALCISAIAGMVTIAYFIVTIPYNQGTPNFLQAAFASFLILHIMGTILLLRGVLNYLEDSWDEDIKRSYKENQYDHRKSR